MLSEYLDSIGKKVYFIDPSENPPAKNTNAIHIRKDYGDKKALEFLSKNCDAITYEFENIPVESLSFLNKDISINPSPYILSISQNRLNEKTNFTRCGINTPNFTRFNKGDALVSVMKESNINFPMNSIKISPSILSADFSKLGVEIQNLEKAKADFIHIDVMDGHFVPNITIGPDVIIKLRKYTSLPFDVHLMISPVNNFIKNFAEAGADIITIHPEATNDLPSSIKKIKSFNKKAGVSLNPGTSIDKVLPVLNTIDLVLIMSVNPGFGGQKFMEETLEKVKILRKEIANQKLKTQIEIDGGINFENAKMAKEAGVDILVSGTTIFKENGGNLKKNIQLLRTG